MLRVALSVRAPPPLLTQWLPLLLLLLLPEEELLAGADFELELELELDLAGALFFFCLSSARRVTEEVRSRAIRARPIAMREAILLGHRVFMEVLLLKFFRLKSDCLQAIPKSL